MTEQVILNNGMRTNASNIKLKKTKLFGKKFDTKLLETLYKLRGRDLKTPNLIAAMGYSPKSANAGTRINKTIERLERDGYVRVVRGGAYARQFFVLKGIPEVDKQLPAYVVIPPAEKEADASSSSFEPTKAPQLDISDLINGLRIAGVKAGVKFKLTIESEAKTVEQG